MNRYRVFMPGVWRGEGLRIAQEARQRHIDMLENALNEVTDQYLGLGPDHDDPPANKPPWAVAWSETLGWVPSLRAPWESEH